MAPIKIVRIKNVGDKPFKDTCDGQTYFVAAGSESLIPFDAAVLWFGNPDAIDIDARRRDRTDEYGRIRVRYGVYEHDELWASQVPKMEVYSLEGEKINMVMDDPEGNLSNPVMQSADTLVAVQQQLLAMQAQQAQLLAAISANPEAAHAIAKSLDINPDVDANADVAEPEPAITDPSAPPAPSEPSQQSNTPPEDTPTRIKVS